MDTPKTPYDYLSGHRAELMGVAILWVVWYHTAQFYPAESLTHPLVFLKRIGYGGVDIFLLVSGMGICNSLGKNSLSVFVQNRLKRVVPVWWTYLAIQIVLGLTACDIRYSVKEVIGFATFTGYWLGMGHQGNWYVYAIMLFYLASPVLLSLLKEAKNRKRAYAVLAMVALLVSTAFFGDDRLKAFSRVPIYVLGMYFALELDKRAPRKRDWVGLFLLLAAGVAALAVLLVHCSKDLLGAYGLWWYPFLMVAPPLSLFLAKFFDTCATWLKPLLVPLAVCGKSSLEILLVSEYLLQNYRKLHIAVGGKESTLAFVAVLSVLIGILFHYCVDGVTGLCFRGKRSPPRPPSPPGVSE